METLSYGIDLPGDGPISWLILVLLVLVFCTVLRYGGLISDSARLLRSSQDGPSPKERKKPNTRIAFRTPTAWLRLLFFLLLVVGILSPYRESRRLLPPRLVVLLDDSRSMDRPIAVEKTPPNLENPRFATPVASFETTPRDAARSMLDLLSWPEDRYRVQQVLLSNEPQRNGLPKPLEKSRNTDTSPIGDRLLEILDASLAPPGTDTGRLDLPAAVVLFSDGLVTEGRSLAEAARRYAAEGVPVVAVACGDERPPADLRWVRSSLPRRAFLGEPLEIPALLRGLAIPESLEVTIRFEQVQGETLRLQQTRQMQPGPGDSETRVPLLLVPRREGVFRYRLTVESPPELREWDRTNNTVEFDLVVDRQRLRVLLIEQSPRFEYRFLRELLRREPEIELRTVLFDADPRAVEQDPLALAPEELTPETVDGFPLVILGDVDPERLGPATISALARAGENRSLILLAGQRFLPRRYLDTPLATVWPQGRFRIEPPSRALALLPANDPLLPRRETWNKKNAESSQEMRDAEPTTVYGAVLLESSGPALRVLGSTKEGETLLGLRRHAGGGVYWQGTDQTWRWREIDNGDFYRRYWLGILRNLSETTDTSTASRDARTGNRKISDFSDDEDRSETKISELERLSQDDAALRLLGQRSGGAFLRLTDLDDPAAWIDSLPRGEPVLDELRRETLISPYFLLPLLLFLLPFLWSNPTAKDSATKTKKPGAAS